MAAVAARRFQQAGTMGGRERGMEAAVETAGCPATLVRRKWCAAGVTGWGTAEMGGGGQNPTNERPFLLLVAALPFFGP